MGCRRCLWAGHAGAVPLPDFATMARGGRWCCSNVR